MAQEISDYAKYNAAHKVAPVTAYLDEELVDLIARACKKQGITKKAFMEKAFVTAVNAAGFTFVLKTKESEAARIKRELEEKDALIAELTAQLKAAVPPQAPAVQANAQGILEEKTKA